MPTADDGRMSEGPMPETLETIAARITAQGKSMDERFQAVDERIDQHFAKVDQQFASNDQRFASIDQRFTSIDQQLAGMKAQLGVKIEAVDAKVDLVYDVLVAQQQYAGANSLAHDEFRERLDNHDVRILALEPPKSADR
jgi:hypothetical protein